MSDFLRHIQVIHTQVIISNLFERISLSPFNIIVIFYCSQPRALVLPYSYTSYYFNIGMPYQRGVSPQVHIFKILNMKTWMTEDLLDLNSIEEETFAKVTKENTT